MNPTTHNQNGLPNGPGADAARAVDETLRLIATLPAPAGLEDRIHTTLRNAHARRPGQVLAWPSPPHSGGAWMRAAAAAAIAFVIVGGGWGVYSRVQPSPPAGAMAAPAHPAGGGFSAAGAIRTPQTLNGPVVTHPAQPNPAESKPPSKHGRSKYGKIGSSAKDQSAARTSGAKPAAPPTQ